MGTQSRVCGPLSPERAGDGEGRQHMRAIEMAHRQLVAQGRPGGLAHEVEGEPLGPCEAELRRSDQARGIHEGDVSEREPHPNRSAVVTMARAMSAILLFSFMALRRISL